MISGSKKPPITGRLVERKFISPTPKMVAPPKKHMEMAPVAPVKRGSVQRNPTGRTWRKYPAFYDGVRIA